MNINITGDSGHHKAKVTNSTPDTGDYGIVVRTVGASSTQGEQSSGDVLTALPIAQGFRAINIASLPTAVDYLDLVYGAADQYGRAFVRTDDRNHLYDSMATRPIAYAGDHGFSYFRATNVDETAGGRTIKATAGVLSYIRVENNDASDDAWFKICNATSVTIGTTAVAYSSKLPAKGSYEIAFVVPRYFSTGIICYATKLVADNDTTAPTSDLIVHAHYA